MAKASELIVLLCKIKASHLKIQATLKEIMLKIRKG